MNTYINDFISVHINICIYICIYMYICIYVYIHIYIHILTPEGVALRVNAQALSVNPGLFLDVDEQV